MNLPSLASFVDKKRHAKEGDVRIIQNKEQAKG